jgi:hypothetical protein
VSGGARDIPVNAPRRPDASVDEAHEVLVGMCRAISAYPTRPPVRSAAIQDDSPPSVLEVVVALVQLKKRQRGNPLCTESLTYLGDDMGICKSSWATYGVPKRCRRRGAWQKSPTLEEQGRPAGDVPRDFVVGGGGKSDGSSRTV